MKFGTAEQRKDTLDAIAESIAKQMDLDVPDREQGKDQACGGSDRVLPTPQPGKVRKKSIESKEVKSTKEEDSEEEEDRSESSSSSEVEEKTKQKPKKKCSHSGSCVKVKDALTHADATTPDTAGSGAMVPPAGGARGC